MKKTQHLNFRLSEEEYLMFSKICDALIVDGEVYNQSKVFRRVIEDSIRCFERKG